MCIQGFDVYLHCSHVVFEPKFCHANRQGTPVDPTDCDQAILTPVGHSWLLCCPSCRGRVAHKQYRNVDQVASLPTQGCSINNTKQMTLPTCARLHSNKENGAASLDLGKLRQTHEQFSSHLGEIVAIPRVYRTCATVENVLRFPHTGCHHHSTLTMPQTALNDEGDFELPCGCWTGQLPLSGVTPQVLFSHLPRVSDISNSVWPVTGQACPKCGKQEMHNHKAGQAGAAMNVTLTVIMPLQEKVDNFLRDVAAWIRLENWKDQYYNGDYEERGTRLAVDSRYAHHDGEATERGDNETTRM